MSKSAASLTLLLVSITCAVCIAVFGINTIGVKGIFDEGGVTLGLDLAGGSVIVYEAQADNPSASEMDAVVVMLQNRLDTLNYSEATVTKSGSKRIRVEIPSISDPEKAVQLLGATAKLEFKDSDGNVVLEGSDIEYATAQYGDVGKGYSEYHVALKFKEEAVKKFSDATAAAAAKGSGSGQNYISITLDGEVKSQPSVEQRLNESTCVISGSFDADSSAYLADVITAGQLPFALKDVQLQSTGPLLGERSLETSLLAGVIGTALVMIFMSVYYRLPGVISVIALIGYIALNCITIVLFKINLSLPGIAGIVLSIGMAVDANVIIFERIKEELQMGKTAKNALKSGFSRAFSAIFDSNITTIIAALVLWYFGSGPIQGFAITLFIGVVISMFSAVVLSQSLLRSCIDLGMKNPKLYGA